VARLLGGVEEEESAVARAASLFADPVEEAPAEGPIRSRFAGNGKLVPIVRKFATRLLQQLGVARAAMQAGDLGEVERLAHWLAGAAGTVGYDAFTEPAREMEAAAKGGDAPLAEAVLQRLLRMSAQLEVPDVATS
jgi:HPt (histidine-containing phosphotransfer) domain-containing protein